MLNNDHTTLSIVVPVYNKEAALNSFFATMKAELDKLDVCWEIICVNDGSREGTIDKPREYARSDDRIKVVDLSRNFGKEAALRSQGSRGPVYVARAQAFHEGDVRLGGLQKCCGGV